MDWFIPFAGELSLASQNEGEELGPGGTEGGGVRGGLPDPR